MRTLSRGADQWVTPAATIPIRVPPGEYLLRVEHIALQQAMQEGMAQFFVACSQVNVTGVGTGVPGPLGPMPYYPGYPFPVYPPNGTGILVDIYNTQPEVSIETCSLLPLPLSSPFPSPHDPFPSPRDCSGVGCVVFASLYSWRLSSGASCL